MKLRILPKFLISFILVLVSIVSYAQLPGTEMGNITVSAGTLSPSFSTSFLAPYNVTIPSTTTSITINATALVSGGVTDIDFRSRTTLPTAGSFTAFTSPVSDANSYTISIAAGTTKQIVVRGTNNTTGDASTYNIFVARPLIDPIVTPTIGSYTFNNTPQGPNAATNTGTGSSYTFIYTGTGATTYASSATPPTNAGTYTVVATVAANGDYASASSSATAFTIGQATPTVTVTVGGPYIFSGSAQGPNAATNTGTGSTYTFSYVGTGATTYGPSATPPTNVGTYTVTASLAASGDGNYTSATSSATAFSITLLTPVVTVTAGGPFTYNGAPQGLNAATNTGTGSIYTFSYVGTGATTYGPSATAPTNAGTYTVTATVAADGSYTSASSSATAFSIGLATPVVTVTAGGPFTFNGAAQGLNAATNTGTGTSYTFSYVGTGATTYGPSATAPTNAGTYTVTATVAAHGNFASASSTATAFSIGLGTPVVTVTVAGPYTFNGAAQGLNAATNTGTGASYTFSYVGTGATTYGPSAVQPTALGTYTVTATVAADGNFASASSAATAFSISNLVPVVTVTVGGPYIFNGSAQGPNAATNTGTGTSYTFSYVGTGATVYGPSATAPTNAGTYTATATVAADGSYSSASSSATAFSIGLGTPVVTPTVGTYTFNGAAQGPNAATNTGTGSSYTFSYVGTGATVYGPSATAPTNVGTYTVTVTVAANGNFASAISSATAFPIVVATPVVTVTVGGPYIFNAAPQGPNAATNTGTGSSYTFSYVGTGATTYGPSATQPTAVGTYTVTATVAANGNFASASSSATAFSITLTVPVVTVTVGGPYTENGAPQGPNAATNTGTGTSYTFVYSGTGATVYGPSSTPPTLAGDYTVVATVAADGAFASASSTATAFTILASGVSGGGGGGLESRSLGDAVAKRIFNKAVNNENGPVNYNVLPQVQFRSVQNRVQGTEPSKISLTSIMPDITSKGYVAYNSSPKDLTSITNAKEVLAFDFTANKEVRAVAFATKTLGELYDHTKPICDRLKGATLVNVETIKIQGFDFVKYTINNEDGSREYATSFSVGTKAGRSDFSLQSIYLTKDYANDETMYNFQLWAGSTNLVVDMVTDILSKLKATAPVNVIKSSALPAAYVESGKREGQNINLVVKNATANTTGYFKLEDKASETAASTVVRNIPFTINANGKSNVIIPMDDKYESTLTMYVGGEVKDVLYMSDGTWTIDYNKSTTVLSSFNVVNDSKRAYSAEEYPLFRNVELKANSSDFVSVVKLLRGGGAAANLNAFKGLKFSASGGYNLHVTLIKNGIVDYRSQYAADVQLELGQQDYFIALDKFTSASTSAKIDAKDITSIVFTVEVGTGRNSPITTTLSNVAFTKEDLNYLSSLEAKELAVYPNPVSGNRITVNFSSAKAAELSLRVTDMSGKVITLKQIQAVKGMNTVQVPVSTGLKAVHIVSLDGADIKYKSTKVMITN